MVDAAAPENAATGGDASPRLRRKELVMKALSGTLRYVGAHSTTDSREYGFILQQDEERRFTLVISNADFANRSLSFQEAPDLCYQKLHAALQAEADTPLASAMCITADDVAEYRERRHSGKALRRR
jgi:hypothetical protein